MQYSLFLLLIAIAITQLTAALPLVNPFKLFGGGSNKVVSQKEIFDYACPDPPANKKLMALDRNSQLGISSQSCGFIGFIGPSPKSGRRFEVECKYGIKPKENRAILVGVIFLGSTIPLTDQHANYCPPFSSKRFYKASNAPSVATAKQPSLPGSATRFHCPGPKAGFLELDSNAKTTADQGCSYRSIKYSRSFIKCYYPTENGRALLVLEKASGGADRVINVTNRKDASCPGEATVPTSADFVPVKPVTLPPANHPPPVPVVPLTNTGFKCPPAKPEFVYLTLKGISPSSPIGCRYTSESGLGDYREVDCAYNFATKVDYGLLMAEQVNGGPVVTLHSGTIALMESPCPEYAVRL